MSAARRPMPGRELPTHLDSAKDLIGQAIEATSDGNYAEALRCWREARGHCVESKGYLAHTWFQSCELAIARLELAVKGDPESVDLTPCLQPDLGQAIVRAKKQADFEAAELEAQKRTVIAKYNRRRHDGELAVFDRALGPGGLRIGSGARAMAERMRADLLGGLVRGISEERWKLFMAGCRREGWRA